MGKCPKLVNPCCTVFPLTLLYIINPLKDNTNYVNIRFITNHIDVHKKPIVNHVHCTVLS